ncbi:hypothetical protein [Microbaculum marinisediminis]|uniref:Uncharacterized protein n=1 Tax=Microbaculum marinisediminis TaxID=2931392 RepID=A0AAW5QVJ6_9HYPH|nr:hypothetical protein [Microbaculum sp. A6E488]MCT8970295.1 hypothetical protein [Microbaculum sp. A6E488]
MSITPAWFFRASVIYALIAMALGIHMAASGNHGQLTTHAHINLVGWVTIFLYGAFLKMHPASNGRLSSLLWLLANAGVILMAIGIYIVYAGNPETGDPFAIVGSLLTILAMAVFAVIVYRARD